MKLELLILVTYCCFLNPVLSDTPANCTYEDIRGLWIFQEGPRGNDKNINCTEDFAFTSAYTVQLDFPNIAVDDNGNIGTWTMIYNQGFEVTIHNRKFFAFSFYKQDGQNVTSYCDSTFPGWSHVTGVNPTDWACYIGAKYDHNMRPKKYSRPNSDLFQSYYKSKRYSTNNEFINEINSKQKSWTAVQYDFLNEKSIDDLIKMAGGKNSRHIINRPKATAVNEKDKNIADTLPMSFDWRNVSGINYVSPIRNQGSCGSCYAFASMAMNEARIRILTNNTQQPILSPQDILDCSKYAQGCEGGFPYLISGKYAEDFGLIDEDCNPYNAQDGVCKSEPSCTRQYSTGYHYVGGFYGACNEVIMRVELLKYGPLVVGFEVYDDFFNYHTGVYHHTFTNDEKNFKFNPFELTNHAVLVVGYGTTEEGEDYWIVKNSWGTEWGESGFFRIRRGTDECAFESLAVGSTPVV